MRKKAIPHKLLFYIFITNVVSKLLPLSPQGTPIGRGFSRMYAENQKIFAFSALVGARPRPKRIRISKLCSTAKKGFCGEPWICKCRAAKISMAKSKTELALCKPNWCKTAHAGWKARNCG
ncbi:MAG: hypothetical protein NTW32_01460 [Chloroflexi bacterium]|nr:hypothetical protein [Chloroflexota bacterium]